MLTFLFIWAGAAMIVTPLVLLFLRGSSNAED